MSRFGANLISLLAVLLLLGAGGWLVAKRRLAAEIAAARAAAEAELSQTRAEVRQARQRSRTAEAETMPAAPGVAAPLVVPAAPPLHRARLVSDLLRSGVLGDRMAWPSPNRNSLAAGMADVAEMLGLSEAETAALQQAAAAGEKEFGAALVAHASVQRDGSLVTISVKDEPGVRAAYDRMQASIAAVLGPERQGYYESLGARDAIWKLFDRWGLGGTTLLVSHSNTIPDAFYPPRVDQQGNPLPGLPRPRGPDRLLYYHTQIKPSQGRGGGASGTDSIANVGINVGPLHTLIPPDL